MSEQLPEYTGEMACCFACDGADAETEYVPPFAGGASQMLDRRNLEGKPWPSVAFLKRTCMRCGYQWAESLVSRDEPLDNHNERCELPAVEHWCPSYYRAIRCVRDINHSGVHKGGGWTWLTEDQDA